MIEATPDIHIPEDEITERFVQSADFANRKDAYRSLAHMVMNNKEAIYRF